MENLKSIDVTKFTLSTGKEIYLRDPSMGDTEKASQIAGKKAGSDNQVYLGVLLQKEMVKLLLVKVGEKVLTMADKEQLDKLFTFKEYNQVLKATQKVMSDEGNEELIPEFVTIGDR